MSRDTDLFFVNHATVEFGILVAILTALILVALFGGLRPVFIAAGVGIVVALYATCRFLNTLAPIADALERLADERGE